MNVSDPGIQIGLAFIAAGLLVFVAALCLWAHLSRSAAGEDERQRRLAEAIELERLDDWDQQVARIKYEERLRMGIQAPKDRPFRVSDWS